MTNAQALELLELRPDQAGNLHQLQRAHARKKQAVQERFDAATSAQGRATLLQKLQSLDLALVLLKADFERSRAEAPKGSQPASPATPAPAPAGPQRPQDWIAATPWNAIWNEGGGEFRSPDDVSVHPPAHAAPLARPARPETPSPSVPSLHKASKPAQSKTGPKAPPAKASVPPERATPPRTAPPARPALPSRPAAPPPPVAPAIPVSVERVPPQKPATIGRTRPAVLMDLPESVLGGAPRVAPDVAAIAGGSEPVSQRRPAQTRLRLPRPEEPSLQAETNEPPIRVRSGLQGRQRNLVPLVLLVLVIAGTAGAAGWAWREGAFDRLLGGGPSLADRGVDQGETSPRQPVGEAQPDPGAREQPQNVTPIPVEDDAATEAAALQAEEIERLTQELTRLADELGGPPGIDTEAQLAAARRAEAAGQHDEAAEALARLQDGLGAQVAAATEAIAARQRLSNAGVMSRETPLAAVAADHVRDLADLARSNIAEGDFATAADEFETALDARLRLARESLELEPARSAAAGHQQRIADVLAELDVTAEGALSEALAKGRSLEGEGFIVEAWLAGQRPAADLGADYERTGAELDRIADQLERIVALRDRMHADSEKLVEVETQVSEMAPRSEQLASWLDTGPGIPDSKAQEGAAALSAGELEDALDAYDAAAQQAAERLEAAVAVRDLISRHAEAAAAARDTLGPVEDQMQEMLTRQASLADRAQSPEIAASWRALAQQIALDLGQLQTIAAEAQDALPADPSDLPEGVRRAEMRSAAIVKAAPAALLLASAEQRLLLLREVGTITGAPADSSGVPEAATEARRALAELAESDARLTQEAIASTARALEEAAEQLSAAGDALASPAADALAETLAQRQAGYRQQFGKVDLNQVWQPEGSTASPAEMADPVAAALAGKADAEALRRELSAGEVGQAQAVLANIRTLDTASAALQALRDAAEEPDEQGRRRLHHSAAAGDSGEVGSLLALAVTPAPRDSQGATPLGLALAGGHNEVARMLLDGGGRPEGWIEAGRPIVFVAAASPTSLRLLLEHGAPARDLHRGETALHALAWQANREQAPTERQLESARILLDAGVDRAVRNRSGATAAELATSLALRELADFLRTAPQKQRP